MLRRHHSTSLNRAAWGRGAGDDVDPNASLTNIADCMLVLMLGFLVALVAHYNIDLIPEEDQIKGIEVNMDANGDGIIDEQFSAAGTVYFDAATGNYYLVEE